MANRERVVRNHAGVFPPPPDVSADKEGRISPTSIVALVLWLRDAAQRLNGGLRLGDDFLNSAYSGNFDGQLIEWTAPAIGATDEVPHGLGRVPLGRIVLGQTNSGSLIDRNIGGWGPKRVYFSSDGAPITFKIWLF